MFLKNNPEQYFLGRRKNTLNIRTDVRHSFQVQYIKMKFISELPGHEFVFSLKGCSRI